MRTLLPFLLCFAMMVSGQFNPRPPRPLEPEEKGENARLPNGKLQQDEIIRADYEKSIEDSKELATLADELRTELEKSGQHVLSIQLIKKTEEIEKLAKRIRGRMKRS